MLIIGGQVLDFKLHQFVVDKIRTYCVQADADAPATHRCHGMHD